MGQEGAKARAWPLNRSSLYDALKDSINWKADRWYILLFSRGELCPPTAKVQKIVLDGDTELKPVVNATFADAPISFKLYFKAGEREDVDVVLTAVHNAVLKHITPVDD